MKNLIATLFLTFLCFLSINAQITITGTASTDCTVYEINSTLDFIIDPSCLGTFVIRKDGVPIFTETDSDANPTFSLTFSEAGEYKFVCDVVPFSVEKQVFCISVVAPIPTLSEWGVIIAMLILIIFGVVSIKQRKLTLDTL